MTRYSEAYFHHLEQGPLPEQIDPWAELGRYFQQLHSGMIDHLLGQIRQPLVLMGYFAGRETSLQIAERREPDLHIRRQDDLSTQHPPLDYPQAAGVVLAEPGIVAEALEPELDAIFIKATGSAELVTVIEIISPRNKTDNHSIYEYIQRRERLLRQGTHVVEIDLTRSVKRLLEDVVLKTFPYHTAIHFHDQPARFIGFDFGETLKRIALPLRSEVIPVELQAAYEHGYRQPVLALQIHEELDYKADELPFPTLFTDSQRQTVVQAAQAWQMELQRLKTVEE